MTQEQLERAAEFFRHAQRCAFEAEDAALIASRHARRAARAMLVACILFGLAAVVQIIALCLR